MAKMSLVIPRHQLGHDSNGGYSFKHNSRIYRVECTAVSRINGLITELTGTFTQAPDPWLDQPVYIKLLPDKENYEVTVDQCAAIN